ncbi:MAG: 4,5-DOPA dioxygenase extradiol [Bacteroidales bacterium]|nr:4,5-DOPA dioxygenase extradiol [Bacteroidales bacterium]
MRLGNFAGLAQTLKSSARMPALFLGHGSPMNALELNEFSLGWRKIGAQLPAPSAILCISAHWETRGTFVTAMERPKTIHDFGGFPKALYEVEYPAPGSPELASEAALVVTSTEVKPDETWGLDHGAWSVIKHLYPKADIPVVQLSLDYRLSPKQHYELARELSALRNKGILIVGSGNIVHNLRLIDWNKPDSGFDWANEADATIRKWIADRNHQALTTYNTGGRALGLSVPTPEHFLPLLYILGLQENNEEALIFNNKTIMGSISMTSVRIG